MASRTKKATGNKVATDKKRVQGRPAKCVALADRGIKTGRDFAQVMSLLIGDIATNRIDARSANAICNAGGKLLKVVEMEHKYRSGAARPVSKGTLQLTP